MIFVSDESNNPARFIVGFLKFLYKEVGFEMYD